MASFSLPDQQPRWHDVEIFFSFFNFIFLSYLFISFTTDCGQHHGVAGSVAVSQLQGTGFNPELRLLQGFPLGSPGFLPMSKNMQLDDLAMLNCP